MRALLDVHSMIRCGEETIIIPKLASLLKYPPTIEKRYEAAKLSKNLIRKAIGTAILTVIEGHGNPAPILCNKDPLTMKNSVELSRIFKNSKYIFMIRDGRAVVHSLISRGITVSGFDLSDYEQCLEKWNWLIMQMNDECKTLGKSQCLPVLYEQLILHPKSELTRILNFLGVPWEDAVLNHHKAVGKEISISKLEWSNDQIAKPINLEALTKWVDFFPTHLRLNVASIAPALFDFGYDVKSYPPNYGNPDATVINNTLLIKNDKSYWNSIVEKFKRKPPIAS
ncbi:hypothetical protein GJ496_004888 [Pomphorhynchus laevis]|nr:hypothetical protein GJ496_004888 [Pomphorhynchus laevis]